MARTNKRKSFPTDLRSGDVGLLKDGRTVIVKRTGNYKWAFICSECGQNFKSDREAFEKHLEDPEYKACAKKRLEIMREIKKLRKRLYKLRYLPGTSKGYKMPGITSSTLFTYDELKAGITITNRGPRRK